MVQLDNLIELNEGIAPPQLYRYNRFVSATVSAGLAEGKTIGQGLEEMDKIAKETLDDFVPYGTNGRLEGVPGKFVEPHVCFRTGHSAYLSDSGGTVREFQRSFDCDADRSACHWCAHWSLCTTPIRP